jgi:di/tricarboxylate transporter
MFGVVGVNLQPFLAAVIMFWASASCMTLVGYQINTMIYGPDNIKISDFARVRTPLNIIFKLLATLLIPIFLKFQLTVLMTLNISC